LGAGEGYTARRTGGYFWFLDSVVFVTVVVGGGVVSIGSIDRFGRGGFEPPFKAFLAVGMSTG